jgi:hypothetical protein
VKNLNAGDLRHRVTVLRDSTPNARDAVGQATPNYQPVGTYYALVECLGGVEATNAKQQKGTLRYKITLRAASGPILPTDQLGWKGITLGVVDATPDPFGIMIEINAVSKGPQ